MKEFYFTRFEHRRPYASVKEGFFQMKIFQVSGILTIISGLVYISWRWTQSLNYDALWFSLTLVIAETISFISILFFVFDMWKGKDAIKQPPPHYLSDIEDLNGVPDRPVMIDVFIATFNEEAELLRYTIEDAKAMTYPHKDVTVRIYILDDGKRDGRDPKKENVKQLCAEEKVIYLTRESNIGFKAGNLKNGLAHSRGDLFVILDADTRPFPGFLENTLGYFRKQKVAWVQTCQWFYDTTEPIHFSNYLIQTFRIKSEIIQRLVKFFTFSIKTGEDIYGSDPRQFYQVIQRRRNYHNASFCCGAASAHRREAVMASALLAYSNAYHKSVNSVKGLNNFEHRERTKIVKEAFVRNTHMTPFRFHASEDLYTSMVLHGDVINKWESVMHPYVESKMLSPQDIDSFVKQRSRYAEGSIDIAIRDNPLFYKGLTWQQKICYFNSVWSYFSCIWTMIFLFSPILFFYTHIMPVNCETSDFFKFFLPFFFMIKLAEKSGSWGVSQKRGQQYHICLFWLNLRAIIRVLSGKTIKFNVTPKSKQKARPLKYAWPHIVIVLATVSGLILNIPLAFSGKADFLLAFVVNGLWALQNCYVLTVFIRAAYWNIETLSVPENEFKETHEPEMEILI